MNTTVDLRCTCGTVQGVLSEASPKNINRCVCYCDDCQAFVRFLGRKDLMDEHGGSDIVQVAPSRLRFTSGIDKVRVMRLSEKGVIRWYTDCCKMPAGNNLNFPRCPFTGLYRQFFVLQGSALDAAVGTPISGIHGRFAIGGCPPGVDEKARLSVVFRSVKWLFGNALAGRHKPSPYWTSEGKLIADVVALSRAERMKYYGHE